MNDRCRSYYIDPELEHPPPHPYSLANHALQNIAKGKLDTVTPKSLLTSVTSITGSETDQSILLLGANGGAKEKMLSDIRYFLVENCFPNIDQTTFDQIDIVLRLLTTAIVPPVRQQRECSILFTFSFASLNHNLVGASLSLHNWELVRSLAWSRDQILMGTAGFAHWPGPTRRIFYDS